MRHRLITQLLQTALLILGVSVISFTAVRMMPGGPMTLYLGPGVDSEGRNRVEKALGLDEALPIQYLKWLNAVVQMDLGRSYSEQRPVADMVLERLPATFTLMFCSLFLGLVTGIPAGVYAAANRGGLADRLIRLLAVLGSALPQWWLGLIAIIVFAGIMKVLPAGGMHELAATNVTLADRLIHLALPSMVLAVGWFAILTRFTRTETLDVLGRDFVRTATAKGLGDHIVLVRHVLRNSLTPAITVIGGSIASLFSGTALVENVFSWPGMGSMALQAALGRDYPVIMGVILISSLLVIGGNRLADLAYGVTAPHTREG